MSDWRNWALGNIVITNSTFILIAAFPFADPLADIIGGTGIGSGANAARDVITSANGISKIGTIMLDGVTITSVKGGLGAPGIGSAFSTNGGESHVDAINIINSVIGTVMGGMTRAETLDRGPGIGTGYVTDFRIAQTSTQYKFGGTSTVDSISLENTQIDGAFGGNEAPGIGAGFTENAEPANIGVIMNRSHIRMVSITNNSNVTAFGGMNANGIGISEIAFSSRTPSDPVEGTIKASSHVDILQIDNTSHVIAYAINFPGAWTGIPNATFFNASPSIGGTYQDDTFNQRDQLWTGLFNYNQFDSETKWLSIGGWVNKPGSIPANIVNATFYKGRDTDGINGINAINTTEQLTLVSVGATDSVNLVIPPMYKYFAFTGEDPDYLFLLDGGPYQNKTIVDRHTTLNLSRKPSALPKVVSETILRLKVLQIRLMVTYFSNTQSVGRPELTSGTVPTDSTVYINDNDVVVQENPNQMTLAGFSFAGWSLNDNGRGTGPIFQDPDVPPGTRNTIINNIQTDQNLYAVWKAQAPPLPIIVIHVDPQDVPPGGDTMVTITIQNIADIAITKNLRNHIPHGFLYLIDSLTINKVPITMSNLNGVELDLGVNEPGEIDIIRFRLSAPLIPLIDRHILRSVLSTSIGEVMAEVELILDEDEE